MPSTDASPRFEAILQQPQSDGGEAPWAFVLVPKSISDTLSRRGRTTVHCAINGCAFQVLLEPDGALSHWFRISSEFMDAARVEVGDQAEFHITPLAEEPEPQLPSDFQRALSSAPEAEKVWNATTTIARIDWVHWIVSAKQAKTRAKRIADACEMLSSGKRRVCCFDPSGFYSKTFAAPKAMG